MNEITLRTIIEEKQLELNKLIIRNEKTQSKIKVTEAILKYLKSFEKPKEEHI